MKKTETKKIIILIIFFSIILFFTYKTSQLKNDYYQDDLTFFKIFNSSYSEKNSETTQEYSINLNKSETKYKNIKLLHIIDEKTLINRKIAPGTNGRFNIVIKANKDLQYEIKIRDKSSKPQNFIFNIQQQTGKISEGERKKVQINWEWQYENNIPNNIQDTIDGEILKRYEFEICTIGK